MEYMSYMIQYYYNVLTSNRFNTPNFTDLFRIVESILYKDPKIHDKQIKRLNELNSRLDEVEISIAELELIFFKNAHKGLNTEIEIKGDTYTLGFLFNEINNVIKELTRMVSEVAYTYNVEMPITSKGSQGVSW